MHNQSLMTELATIKSPTGGSVGNTVAEQFKKASKQSDRMLLDLSRIGFDEAEAFPRLSVDFTAKESLLR